MKLNRDKELSSSDYNALFTRDPGNFIEHIIVNLMWAKKSDNEGAIVARQRYVFERWLEFYTKFIRDDMLPEVTSEFFETTKQAMADAEAAAYRRGQIHALANLPTKKSAIGRNVDLNKVTQRLRELRAKDDSNG